MKLGVGTFSGQLPPQANIDRPTLYEQTLNLCQYAEDVGFASAWLTEHHFVGDGYTPSPLTLGAAIGARTDSLEIGTGIALAPLYDPIRLAETAAMVDNLAAAGGDGAFYLGLGLGYRNIEFEAFGTSKSERVKRLIDVVKVCQQAWNDESITHDGLVRDYPEVNVTPKPNSDLPVLLGPVADVAIERTARIADGYVSPVDIDLEGINEAIDLMKDVMAEENRDPDDFDIYITRYAFPHDDGAEAAWETVREHYLYVRRKYLEWFNASEDSDLSLTEAELDDKVDEYEKRWRSWMTCGTPEEIVDEFRPYADCWDDEIHLVSQLWYPGLAYDEAEEALRLYGERVIPELSDV